MDQQAEKDKTETVTGLGRKNERGDSKVKPNDRREIPDRGETSDIPGLPLGVSTQKYQIWQYGIVG